MNVPANIIINAGGPDRYDLECSLCQMGYSGGATFGPIKGADLAASFMVQHATHDKKGAPSGLTPGGKARASALEVLR